MRQTARTTGTGDVWPQTLNNGIASGNLVLHCNDDAKRASLYYQSSTSSSAGGIICVGKSCGATVCTNDFCWGEPIPPPLTSEKVSDYIAFLSGDYEWYLSQIDAVASFSWSSDWTNPSPGVYQVDIVYVRTSTVQVSVDNIIDALAETTGVAAKWFDIIIKSEGGLSQDTFATLFLADPASFTEDQLGGFVDILFFAGTVGSPNAPLSCNINSVCQSRYYAYKKRYCYRYIYSNLVGEYSGDEHVNENQCVAGVNPAWGSVTVAINENRNGGTYKMQCDDKCRYCKQEGSFKGDECVCYLDLDNPVATGYAYYCISVKYASAPAFSPSVALLVAIYAITSFLF